jgi:hypothetical protein
MVTLKDVKNGMSITHDYNDDTLQIYFDEVIDFIKESGVAEENITAGLVTRGVSDLWNYGGDKGVLSPYFLERATQLAYKE